jgi:hypothetical protein
LSALSVWVIDFDTQVDPYWINDTIFGPVVTEVAEQFIQTPDSNLGYAIKSPI